MTDAHSALELTDFITFRMSRLQNRMSAQAIRLLRENSSLSMTEWRILAVAVVQKEITLSQLARMTHLDKGQLSRGVSSLVQKDLLRSQINDMDNRQHILTVSATGQTVHDSIFPLMQGRQRDLTADLSAEELDVFHEILDKLEATMDRA